MEKVEFQIDIDKQPVDELRESMDKLEEQAKELQKTDLGLEGWSGQFEKFKRELKGKADEIEVIKARILSFNNWDDRRGLDSLAARLNTAKNEYYFLAQEAANASNAISQDFSRKINEASQVVNQLTEKIIEQKNVVRNVEADVKRLGEAYREAVSNPSLSGSDSLSEYNVAKRALEEERAALFELTQEQAKACLSVQGLKEEYTLYGNGSEKVVSSNVDIVGSLKQVISSFANAGTIKDFISEVISTTGEFQKMEVVLTNTLGSASKAKEAMNMLTEFGTSSSFKVNELTSSFVMLANQGFVPTEEQMRKLGDLASYTGNTFDQLAKAVLDAQNSDFEGLGDFGIHAAPTEGDNVIFTFKEQQTVVQNTASAIREYILSLGDLEGVVGANERMSATFTARLSAIQDILANQLRLFGETFDSELSLGLDATAAITKNLNSLIPVLAGVVTAYGAYHAALLLVNAAQRVSGIAGMIKSIIEHTRTVNIATAAQKAFNLASSANVWPALISLVLGLGSAVYMFSKKANEGTEAQKRYNDAVRESEKGALSEQRELANLRGELAATAKGTDEYNNIRDKIVANYGKYDSNLRDEIDNVGLLDETYVKLTESINESFGARQYQKFKQEQESSLEGVMSDNLGKIQNRLYDDLGEEEGARVYSKIRFAILERRELDEDIKSTLNEVQDKGTVIADSRVDSYIRNIREAQRVTDEFDEKARVKFGINENNGKNNKPTTIIPPDITQEISSATQKISELNQQIKDLRDGKGKADQGKTVKETIEARLATLRATEGSLAVLTGEDKNAGKDGRDDQKQRLEKEKSIHAQLQALRAQNQQDEINLMQEGAEKKKAQIELDYDREIAAIRAKVKEWEEAQNGELTSEQTSETHGAFMNAHYKKQQATTQVDKDQADADKKAADDKAAAESQAMNGYLKEYGTYLQKRQAITDLYNDKIAKATTEGEKLSLGKELTKSLSTLDTEANKSTAAISRLFGDMSKKSVKDLRAIADQGKEALDFLKGGKWDAATGDKLGMSEDTFNTLSASPEEIEKVGKAVTDVSAQADQCDTAFNQMGIGLRKMFNSNGDEKKLAEGMAILQAGMGKATQAGQFLSGALSSMGDALGSDTLTGMAEGLNVAMDAADAAMKGAQAGAMFGPMGMAAGAAVGAVTSLVSSFAKLHDAKYEKRIQEMQKEVDNLGRAYDRLGRAIDNTYSNAVYGMMDEQAENLKRQQQLVLQQKEEEEAKKKTDKKKTQEYDDKYEELGNQAEDLRKKQIEMLAGTDVRSAIDEFADALVEAYAQGEDGAEAMGEVTKKVLANAVKEALKKQLLGDALKNAVTRLGEDMEDGSLSDEDKRRFENSAQSAGQRFMEAMRMYDDLFKGEGGGEEESPREASAKGIASMSQESADLLNGQFTTQLIYLDRTCTEVTGIREQMAFIHELQIRGWEDVRAIRDMSGRIAELSDRIATVSDKIEVNTGWTARGIQDINDKGVLMRGR